MKIFAQLFLYCFLGLPNSAISAGVVGDTINVTQSLSDGETLVSANGIFELGFISPGSTSRRYLGLWYKQTPDTDRTIAWVANRQVPINDSSGFLQLSQDGILVLVGENSTSVWSSNVSKPAHNPVAQLLDSGNLVVRDLNDRNSENYLWQSFDYPTDTFIPGMKLGFNRITGQNIFHSSWKSSDDPSPGDFTYGFDISELPQLLLRENSTVRFRSGPWNGYHFAGVLATVRYPLLNFRYFSNDVQVYFTSQVFNSSTIARMVLTPEGGLRWFTWTGNWTEDFGGELDACDFYATCGTYGMCDNNRSPLCSCLNGFEPRKSRQWDLGNASTGCVRKTPLDCSSDGFQKLSKVKVPDTLKFWADSTTNLEECKRLCLLNCSCTAYANLNITQGGSGCLQWFVDLIDMRTFPETGQDIYVRLAASDIPATDTGKTYSNSSNRVGFILGVSLSVGVLIIGLTVCVWRRKQCKRGFLRCFPLGNPDENHKDDIEIPVFGLLTVASATNDFAHENKLGEGGFGPVYKGVLKDGQEIAVKRLSRYSKQGLNEFKNEVSHIAKLQHRNLVKLVGCCIEADEKMLIYEFMPNKSLDFFLFADQIRSMPLTWPQRYHIVNGIARGLLYLHQDSRQRIIHRDLKADNVLLDHEMNPKISDFGLARSFGEKEIKAKTKKVVGTYGYMSPEYAIDGLYSIKSDVFSYGVLVLEIVTGMRNRRFYHPDHHHNLLGHAWKLFCEDRSWELIAEPIRDTCNLTEVQRSIHIGLLCVQRNPIDRPGMSAVVLMLGGEGQLPPPTLPGFYTEREVVVANSSKSSSQQPFTANRYTITVLEPR